MTAPATTRRAGPFNGNGVTVSFPFTFKVFATSDIAVVKTSTAGLDSTLVLASDYSVALNADQDASPGGTITYPISGTPLAVGEKLTAVGSIPYDQTADLPTGGNYRARVVEDALDRTVFQVQQIAEELGRALTLPASAATADTELPAPEAGKVIAWNSTGTALVNVDSGDLASVVVAGTAYTDVFSGTGAQTAFALTSDPGGVNALDVAISGVSQVNGVDFTVSGTTLTFTAAPPAATGNICVRYVAAVPIGSANAQDVTYTPGSGSVEDKLLEMRKSVEEYGGVADGVTNNDTAIGLAAAASGGRFHFPGPGIYVCSSGVWAYAFTAGDNVTLKIAGVDYVVSNAIAGPWRLSVDSPVLMSLRHAATGNVLQQWQNGAGGTATYFYRGLSIQTDSHAAQMGPATNGGSVDLLFQRSVANADSGGNRFNLTFEESSDRFLASYATTASGAPSFDSWVQVSAGVSPALIFPAIAAQFNSGVGVKQRAAGGFECRFVPTSSTVADIKQIGGSGTTFISFRDGAMGVFGSAGTARVTLPAAATDAASTQTLANAIRTALIGFGWCA